MQNVQINQDGEFLEFTFDLEGLKQNISSFKLKCFIEKYLNIKFNRIKIFSTGLYYSFYTIKFRINDDFNIDYFNLLDDEKIMIELLMKDELYNKVEQ